MDNITLDTGNFSDQLGIYDFFNILVSGAIFVFGLCTIHDGIYHAFWDNVSVPKGLAIIFLIYLIGLVMQETGSLIDKYFLKIHKSMSRDFLKSSFDPKRGEIKTNSIISNPILLEHYRNLSDMLHSGETENIGKYNDDDVNQFMFSVCQYYVAASGKDKKVEKMRALFGMSKSLLASFFILLLINLTITVFAQAGCCNATILLFTNRWSITLIFAFLSLFFYYRMKKTMRYMLLILLGSYDACLRLSSCDRTK